ncbi:hypothetical protein D3C74_310340 [compost metagenome]
MTPEQIERLKEAYNRTPVDGSQSATWTDEGKEAYQDGFNTALDLLGIKVEGLNA